MLFKFKEKPIVLDAFTVNPIAHDIYPIVPAIKALPSWFKKLKRPTPHTAEQNNMKNCPGFINLYKEGFIIPFSVDSSFYVEHADSNERRDYAAENFPHITPPRFARCENSNMYTANGAYNAELIGAHTMREREGWARDYENFKICVPWGFNCNKYIKFMFVQPGYTNMENPMWFSPPGMIDFKYNSIINMHIMIDMRKNNLVRFPAGSPLCHLIPLTEKKVELHTHYVSEEEWKHRVKFYWNMGKKHGGYIKGVARMENGL